MALSYSNSNIEAGLVQATSKEKIAPADDATANTRSKPDTRLLHLIQLLLHVVSITAVIWLVVQVLHLQRDLVRLNSEGTWLSDRHTLAGPSSNLTSGNDGGKSRSRRQSNQTSSVSVSQNYYDYDYGPGEGHPFFHVTGSEQSVSEDGNWFTFHTSEELEFTRYSHESLKFVQNKFMEVTMPGYYFVYSQISYAGNGLDEIGHEVVVLPDCGEGNPYSILRAKAFQGTTWKMNVKQIKTWPSYQPFLPRRFENAIAKDTGYTGGVFYLAANDRLGVRPSQSRVTQNYEADIAETSYFGAFLLSADVHQEVDPDLRRCP